MKFIVEDEQGKPDTAVTKAKKLILQDKVHMFVGGLLASTGYALAPVSTAEKVALRHPGRGGGRPDAARPRQIPLFHPDRLVVVRSPAIRSGNGPATRATRRSSPSAPTMPSVTKWSAASSALSRPAAAQIIQKIWPPIGTKDFGPYIPTMKAGRRRHLHADGRTDVAAIPEAAAASGNKKPVIGGGTSYDEFVLPSMGDEVIGHVSALQYSAALETPKNEAFVKAYRAKFGKVPSYYSETNYTTAR